MKRILMWIIKSFFTLLFLFVAYIAIIILTAPRVESKKEPAPISKFDPDKYYLEHSKIVSIQSDNDLGHRAFAVRVPSGYEVDKGLVYYGERKDAKFYFYHDIDFLSNLVAGKAYQMDKVKGSLEPFGEYERNENTINGYTHQGFHFLSMGGLDYFFRCSYKITFKDGKDMCTMMIKNIIPSTISKEYFDNMMNKYAEMLSPTISK